MKIRGLGVSLPPNDTMANFDKLKNKLDQMHDLGFTAVELSIHGMNIICNGKIDHNRLEAYIALLRSYPLRYTTHAPYDLNLFRAGHKETEQQLFMASLEITSAIGAETMVYHVGRYVGEEEFLYPHLWPNYTKDEKQKLLKREQIFLRKAGDEARKKNIKIGLENMRPYLDCVDYCYAVLPHLLVKQVTAINHPNVGIVLDTGHLYLSHKMYGLDMKRELNQMSSHIIHIHLHDNFGKVCFSTEKNQFNLIPLGRGDMHMPAGNGEIPLSDMFHSISNGFDGILIHETREIYEYEWSSFIQRTQTIVENAGIELEMDAINDQAYAIGRVQA